MRSSTGSPSTKRTDATPPEAGPGAAGAAPGPASARADVPPHLKLPRRLWLLPPACGVLVALCAVLAGWHAPAPAEPAGFDLRAGPASSNVDSNSAGPAGADPARVPAALAAIAAYAPDGGRRSTALVCTRGACQPPVHAPDELAGQLAALEVHDDLPIVAP